jgi:hypothetical protein
MNIRAFSDSGDKITIVLHLNLCSNISNFSTPGLLYVRQLQIHDWVTDMVIILRFWDKVQCTILICGLETSRLSYWLHQMSFTSASRVLCRVRALDFKQESIRGRAVGGVILGSAKVAVIREQRNMLHTVDLITRNWKLSNVMMFMEYVRTFPTLRKLQWLWNKEFHDLLSWRKIKWSSKSYLKIYQCGR